MWRAGEFELLARLDLLRPDNATSNQLCRNSRRCRMVKVRNKMLAGLCAGIFAILSVNPSYSKKPDLPSWQTVTPITPSGGQSGSPANLGPSGPPTPYDNCCNDCDSSFESCALGGVVSCFIGGIWCMATLDLCGFDQYNCYQSCQNKFLANPTGMGNQPTTSGTKPVRRCNAKEQCKPDEWCMNGVCAKPPQ